MRGILLMLVVVTGSAGAAEETPAGIQKQVVKLDQLIETSVGGVASRQAVISEIEAKIKQHKKDLLKAAKLRDEGSYNSIQSALKQSEEALEYYKEGLAQYKASVEETRKKRDALQARLAGN